MAMKKSGKVSKKDIEIVKILKENPEGLRTKTLEKLLNLRNRTLYNRLHKLRDNELVENIFPIWRLCQNQSSYSKITELLAGKEIQAHKFSFTLSLIKKPDWWKKRENKLMKLKEFNFKPRVKWGNNPYEILLKNNFQIQTFHNSIVFINQKKYWADDPYLAFIEALQDTLEMLRFIEERFKFKFFYDGIQQFSVRSQHLVKLRDSVAERCKKDKLGYEIIIDGRRRVWVDMSEPFGREAGHKDYAPEDMDRLQKRDRDVIQNNPPIASEIWGLASSNTQTINGILENQVRHEQTMINLDKNMETHFDVLGGIKREVGKLGVGVKALTKAVRSEAKPSSKKDFNQTTLESFI